MSYTLIPIENNRFALISDAEIVKNDYVIDENNHIGIVTDCSDKHNIEVDILPDGKSITCIDKDCDESHRTGERLDKLLATYPKLYPDLPTFIVECPDGKTFLKEDVGDLIHNYSKEQSINGVDYKFVKRDFTAGYNQHQSTHPLSMEEIVEFAEFSCGFYDEDLYPSQWMDLNNKTTNPIITTSELLNLFIAQKASQRYEIELEMEDKNEFTHLGGKSDFQPKLTEGQYNVISFKKV